MVKNGKKRLIFVRSFRHWRTGKIVRRADGGVFAFEVDVK